MLVKDVLDDGEIISVPRRVGQRILDRTKLCAFRAMRRQPGIKGVGSRLSCRKADLLT